MCCSYLYNKSNQNAHNGFIYSIKWHFSDFLLVEFFFLKRVRPLFSLHQKNSNEMNGFLFKDMDQENEKKVLSNTKNNKNNSVKLPEIEPNNNTKLFKIIY